MFAYVDESGNTGPNLFDPNQPIYMTGAMMVREDFDQQHGQRIAQIAASIGAEEHHGNELGVGGILPTLFLIIGVLVAGAVRPHETTRKVDRFLFRLSMGLSAAYLLVVLATILIQPISPLPPPELMRQSHLWLAPFQGLVTGCLGAFFIRRE